MRSTVLPVTPPSSPGMRRPTGTFAPAPAISSSASPSTGNSNSLFANLPRSRKTEPSAELRRTTLPSPEGSFQATGPFSKTTAPTRTVALPSVVSVLWPGTAVTRNAAEAPAPPPGGSTSTPFTFTAPPATHLAPWRLKQPSSARTTALPSFTVGAHAPPAPALGPKGANQTGPASL